MSNKNLSEGVGKKIVEALKKQSEIEINPISSQEEMIDETFEQDSFDTLFEQESDELSLDALAENDTQEFSFEQSEQTTEQEEFDTYQATPASTIEEPSFAQNVSPNAFTNFQQPAQPIAENFASELDNFEIPSNIAVLKKLISQLPTGVTRHTGAQIIRQTMEALGISMKSVLQEAQQVQDGLNNSARECQSTIQEYKKQIIALEKQAQSHQRQYSALNELISLFIQTGR